ncbi:hypothetical protein LTR85_009017 [Meristemomyces frigidus]|nr:hypothetical protein LTR85_009017 [Meristemomyces frigidus]
MASTKQSTTAKSLLDLSDELLSPILYYAVAYRGSLGLFDTSIKIESFMGVLHQVMRPLRCNDHLHEIGLEQMLEANVILVDARLPKIQTNDEYNRDLVSADTWLGGLPTSLMSRLVHLDLRVYFGSRHEFSRFQ